MLSSEPEHSSLSQTEKQGGLLKGNFNSLQRTLSRSSWTFSSATEVACHLWNHFKCPIYVWQSTFKNEIVHNLVSHLAIYRLDLLQCGKNKYSSLSHTRLGLAQNIHTQNCLRDTFMLDWKRKHNFKWLESRRSLTTPRIKMTAKFHTTQ